MHKGVRLLQDATVEPVSLTDAKAYLHIDPSDTSNDSLVSSLITAARRVAEDFTRLCFISQQWEMWADRFPNAAKANDQWWDGTRQGSIVDLYGAQGNIKLLKSPLISVQNIFYWDLTDTQNPMDLSITQIDTAGLPGRIFLKFGQIWPVGVRPINGVQIQFTAGFGTTAADVPPAVVQAIKILVAHYFENREPVLEGRALETPLSVRQILQPYRVARA